MRPLRLELEGWARFRERQEISFDDLTLFAISGPTGAGKTLLLDALSFALFGVTPRLSQKLETLISHEADRLMVELQFEVAAGIHRVVRTIERKPSGTASKSIRIEKLQDGRWKLVPETDRLKEADQRLEQLVGFDFRSFTRSILLPQGQFDEFLHGDARLRRSLLKELLDLGRVELMREEAGKRERSDAATLAGIDARLEAAGLEQAPVRLRQLRSELEELEQFVAAQAEELAAGRRALAEAEEVAGLQHELAGLQPRLTELEAAREHEPDLRRELEAGRRALALEPLLRLHGQLEQRSSQAAVELSRLGAQQQEAQAAHEAARTAAAAAQAELSANEAELKEAIARLHDLLPLAQRLRRLGGAPAGGSGDASVWDEAQLDRLLSLRERLAALSAARGRLTRQEQRQAELAAEVSDKEAQLASQREALARLLEQGTAAGARVAAAEQLVKQLETSGGDAAAGLRAGLVSGEPCPVCGQTVHELPGAIGHELAAAREELQRSTAERQDLRERYAEVQAAVAGLSAGLKAAAQAIDAGAAEQRESSGEVERLQAEFAAAGLTGGPEELSDALAVQLNSLLAAGAARLEAAGGGSDPAAAAKELDRRLTALKNEERRTSDAAAAALNALNVLESRLELLTAEQASRTAELEQRRTELDAGLGEAGFAGDAELLEALRPAQRLEEIDRQLEANSRDLATLQLRRADLLARLAGRESTAEGLAALQARVAELEAARTAALERRGAVQTAISHEQALVEEFKKLQARRRELEDSREMWKLLSRDLQDHNFTDFLLAGVQQLLAARASTIIRQVTDGRFDLHLSASREFEVSDAWAGAQRRSVKSLSGGETFIVSLALALALSDTAAGGRRLGALFLDEGFGTLDAAMLDSVASVLENLSTDGRMVGIITHVSELSERMPARLIVTKEAGGSTVHWED